jgi:hypothetical protein
LTNKSSILAISSEILVLTVIIKDQFTFCKFEREGGEGGERKKMREKYTKKERK